MKESQEMEQQVQRDSLNLSENTNPETVAYLIACDATTNRDPRYSDA